MKKYPTIGCCGIDCGLCPRYYTDGRSRCPGCGGKDFSDKHPSCSILTCCFKNRKLETCATCQDFVCRRIKNWDVTDSFVTHRVSLQNLRCIKKDGISPFMAQQDRRMKLLEGLLRDYDDGRSKGFFCLSAALLPLDELETAVMKSVPPETAAKQLRETIADIAVHRGIELSYRKPKA